MLRNLLPGLSRALGEFAVDNGLVGPTQRYIVSGNEMLHESVAGLAGLPVADVHLPFVARRISLKVNLRIEGIERMPGVTAKLHIPARGVRPSVLRDIRGRRIVRAYLADPKVGIPEIRGYDRKNAGWLIEDFIDGREATKADVTRFVWRHAASVSLPLARLVRVRRSPRLKGLIDALERSLRRMFPPVPHEALWPIGFGHNDLKRDNLLRAPDGKFWLVDWERSGVVPLAANFGKVYLDFPTLGEPILSLLGAADPDERALSPRHQLALGASLALQNRAHVLVRDAMIARGISERQALREIDRTIRSARRAIAQLAA
jgi:hypothetical protein